MAYFLFLGICLTFFNPAISQSAFVNVSISSTVVKLGESFDITVDFYPTTFGQFLESLKCGYVTGSSAFSAFVHYSLHRTKFELVLDNFPADYVDRIKFPSTKRFNISNVKFVDEGTKYYCDLRYNLGDGSAAKFLSSNKVNLTTVYALPVFDPNLPAESVVIEGRNTTLNCIVKSRPVSAVTWSYESGINAIQSNSSIASGDYVNANGMLKIINASSSLNGKKVTCTGTPVYGSPIVSTTTLSVSYLPISTAVVTATLKPVVNSQVMINCTSDAVPAPMYIFYQVIDGSDTEVSSANSRTKGVLIIPTITLLPGTYRRIYKCVPYNIMGKGAAKIVTFDVQVPPNVTATMSPSTVNASGSATLQCAVTAANPPASLTGHDAANNPIALEVSGLAQITNVTRGSSGKFSCRADNGVGSPVIKYAELFVNHLPESVSLTASSLKPLKGDSVTLNCTATATPEAKYRFYIMKNSNFAEILNNGSGLLTINKINYVEAGNYLVTYRCIPYNFVGDGAPKELQLDIQNPDSGEIKDDKTAMIAGIAGGSVLFLLILVLVIVFFMRKRRSSQAIECGNGGVATSCGEDADKNKNNDVVMKDMNGDQSGQYFAPNGDIYSMVSKKR